MKRGKFKPNYDFRDFGNDSRSVHFASSENRHLAIHHANTEGCGFCNHVAGRQTDEAPGRRGVAQEVL
jgi:hypothetical protein